ncbi:MAG TPA: hypothetical protein P5316_13640, partial [Phycisphaerae bacterium]|nr:hypothetical protein [Phycisphaerae bacterium]
MTDQVGDRVALPSPRRPLDENTRIGLKALDNLPLFFVGRQREKKAIPLAAGRSLTQRIGDRIAGTTSPKTSELRWQFCAIGGR